MCRCASPPTSGNDLHCNICSLSCICGASHRLLRRIGDREHGEVGACRRDNIGQIIDSADDRYSHESSAMVVGVLVEHRNRPEPGTWAVQHVGHDAGAGIARSNDDYAQSELIHGSVKGEEPALETQ